VKRFVFADLAIVANDTYFARFVPQVSA